MNFRPLSRALHAAVLGFVAVVTPFDSALAQPAYPAKPIRLIVPFPPGGGTDMIARTVAQKMAEQNKWSVVVDNRPGAGGNIGLAIVAKAPPDGYTLGVGAAGALAANSSLYAQMPFDPAKDFKPVSMLAAIPFAYVAIASSPYRMKRITAFLDPWANRQGSGYQVAESLMSIGSGGLTGLGLGDGRQKLFFLPEAHTDFIFAIIGEELGLLGVAFLISLYAIVIWRGLRAALNATEAFGTYLGLGIVSLVAFQACVNMAVAMGVVPTKGLTLPFISYGGSSLIMLMGAAGLLLSISATAENGARKRAPVSRTRNVAMPSGGGLEPA